MEWLEKTPEYGDLVRTKRQFYYHYGIFVNEDRIIQFGLPDYVFQPAEQIQVLVSDIYTFLQDSGIEVAKPNREERKRMRSPNEIVALAESRIGEGGYDILHNNCEHFVNECAFGDHSSEFLMNIRKKLRKKLGKKD